MGVGAGEVGPGVSQPPGSGGGGGSGTVTSVSVASANGLAGTVANPTTTPAITLSTTVTGILKGNGTTISAAAAGTDYLAPNGNGSALSGITASQVGAVPAPTTGDVVITTGGVATLQASSNVESVIRANSPDQLATMQGNFSGGSHRGVSWADGLTATDLATVGQIPGVATIAASGTYTPTVSGVYQIVCVGAGGGGGGGGSNTGTTAGTTSGQGGAGGGIGSATAGFQTLVAGTPYTVTIGVAGVAGGGGAAGGAHAGSGGGQGGTTSFVGPSATISGPGGGGGSPGPQTNATTNNPGGVCGVPVVGLTNTLGQGVLQGQGGTSNVALGNTSLPGAGPFSFTPCGAGGAGGGAGTTSKGGSAGVAGSPGVGGAAGTNAAQGTGLGQTATDAVSTSYGAGGGGGGGGNNSLAAGNGGAGGPGVIYVIGPLGPTS